MKIKPMGDRFLIKPKEQETKTTGGIYLPDNAANDVYVEGEVIEVPEMEKCALKKGDKVLYEAHAGTEIKLAHETFRMVQLRDIVAKVQ
jgi:chaperonin GroES